MTGVVSVPSELKIGEREEYRVLSGVDKTGGYSHPVAMGGKCSFGPGKVVRRYLFPKKFF